MFTVSLRDSFRQLCASIVTLVQAHFEPCLSILNISVPLISGAVFGAVGLSNKYPTATKYVYSSVSAWIYIFLSSGGALVTTLIMQTIGTKVIQDNLLNSFFLGLLGAGAFMGIISRFPISKPISSETGSQLRTIRDFIFKFLDNSIAKRVMQAIETEIHALGRDIDIMILSKEAARLIGGPKDLTARKKNLLIIQFDEYTSRGDYASIIRELIKYYDISYIIKDLSKSISTDRLQKMSAANDKDKTIVGDRKWQNAELPEYIAAQMFASRKETESALYYLKQTLEKVPSFGQDIASNDHLWWTFTSITHGESELEKLDSLMSLIGVERPTFEEIRECCNQHGNKQYHTFMAVKKNDGNCVRITIKYNKSDENASIRWEVRGDWDLERHVANLDEVMDLIKNTVIPTRILL